VIPEPVVLGPAGALELQPEIILPEQLDDLGRRCRIPEHRLMLAVLEDAVAVFQAGCVSQHLGSRPLFPRYGGLVRIGRDVFAVLVRHDLRALRDRPRLPSRGSPPLAGLARGSIERRASRILRLQTRLGHPPSRGEPPGAP
jgi:hypothetical protein